MRGDIASEVEPWRAVKLRCGIGHVYGGRVRRVQIEGRDIDGDLFLYPPSNEFDPKTCVVCGLQTWAVAPVDGSTA